MANEKVTYEIRLKDLMSKTLRGLSKRVRSFSRLVRTGLVKALKMARVALKAFAVGVGATTAAMGAIGFAAVRMGQSFLEAASNLEDTQSKFATVFRGIEDEAMGMVESISEGLKFGQGSVMGFMATFQDTLVPLGFAREEAAGMSAGLTALAVDLTAFNPQVRNTEQAISALQSVLVGMYRPALQFGVAIDSDKVKAEALALGLMDLNGELGDQAKRMAALSLLLKGTTDAHGAFLRMQDSLTVQTIQFNEAITDLREEMGLRLKTALSDAINDIGGIDVVIMAARIAFEFFTKILADVFIPALITAGENLVRFVEALGGVDEATALTADGVGLLGESFVTSTAAAFLGLMLLNNGLSTIIGGFQGFYYAVKANLLLLSNAFLYAIKKANELTLAWYEVLDSLVTFLANTAIKVFGELVKATGNVVSAIGDALIAYSSLPFVSESFFDLGNEALAAGRKIQGWGHDIAKNVEVSHSPIEYLNELLRTAGGNIGEMQDQVAVALELAARDLENIAERWDYVFEGVPPEAQAALDMIKDGSAAAAGTFKELRRNVASAVDAMKGVEITSPEQADAAAALTAHLETLMGILDKVPQGYNNAAAAAQGFNKEAGETTRKISGMNDGVKEFRTRMKTMGEDIAAITENAIVAFGNGLTDAFVSMIDGSKSAKEAFADFASQFLIDIGRMIIQMLIFQAIAAGMGMLGFGNTMFGGLAKGGTVDGGVGEMTPLANGGVVSGGLGRAFPLKGYANGGPIVDKPHIALIGEGKHNEAVVPLPDGRSIPVEMNGGGGANVTVEINAVDARSVDMLFRERKDTLTEIIRQAISQSRQFRSAVGGA